LLILRPLKFQTKENGQARGGITPAFDKTLVRPTAQKARNPWYANDGHRHRPYRTSLLILRPLKFQTKEDS
jgi:hypothetical protein